MKKNICKILVVLMFALQIILIANNVFAAGQAWTPNFSELENKGAGNAETSVKDIMGAIITIIRIIGTGISIIMITYVAIKYMSAAPQEKAEFKKSATALIVGAVVLFAGTNILTIISNFATTNIK